MAITPSTRSGDGTDPPSSDAPSGKFFPPNSDGVREHTLVAFRPSHVVDDRATGYLAAVSTGKPQFGSLPARSMKPPGRHPDHSGWLMIAKFF